MLRESRNIIISRGSLVQVPIDRVSLSGVDVTSFQIRKAAYSLYLRLHLHWIHPSDPSWAIVIAVLSFSGAGILQP